MKYLLIAAAMLAVAAIGPARAQQCMPCMTKCSICFNAGKSTFPSIDACRENCRATGNRPVLARCGVRAACPAN